MVNEVTLEQLMKRVEDATRTRDELREAESMARRSCTKAENDLIAAERALVDYLVSKAPRLADEIAARRGLRRSRGEGEG